jgi:hypothetical protein
MKNNTDRETDFAEIDRILTAEQEVVPSSGFLAATMERVREEAVAPAPIPFPWARAIPGLVLVAAVLALGVWQVVRYVMTSGARLVFSAPALAPTNTRSLAQAGWVALALIVSYGSWMFSARMMRRSSLL